MQTISNRQLTLIRKLGRKKHRWQEGYFMVEGERAVQQVVENGYLQVEHLFFDREQRLWEIGSWKNLSKKIDTAVVDSGDFVEIADTDHPQGVLAQCVLPEETGLDRLVRDGGILVAADRIQDPGNLGTIIRSAAWFGVGGLLAGKGTVDLFHPKVVRSTAGATGAVPYRNSRLADDLNRLQQLGWRIVLLDARPGSVSLHNLKASGKQVVVIGNEANGIDEKLFSEDRTVARIDPAGGEVPVESLNAAIALSIALYALGV